MGQGKRCCAYCSFDVLLFWSPLKGRITSNASCIFLEHCRLFSCGTNKDGESHIVEWNESEGAVKRSYLGLGKRSVGAVQFDTTKNRFLAAGDEFVIKFWDMDDVNLLTTTDADGGLPVKRNSSLPDRLGLSKHLHVLTFHMLYFPSGFSLHSV